MMNEELEREEQQLWELRAEQLKSSPSGPSRPEAEATWSRFLNVWELVWPWKHSSASILAPANRGKWASSSIIWRAEI